MTIGGCNTGLSRSIRFSGRWLAFARLFPRGVVVALPAVNRMVPGSNPGGGVGILGILHSSLGNMDLGCALSHWRLPRPKTSCQMPNASCRTPICCGVAQRQGKGLITPQAAVRIRPPLSEQSFSSRAEHTADNRTIQVRVLEGLSILVFGIAIVNRQMSFRISPLYSNGQRDASERRDSERSSRSGGILLIVNACL